MKNFNFALSIILVGILITVLLSNLGCLNKSNSQPTINNTSKSFSTFKDSRDGQIYKTVVIGSQEWFSENLKFKSPSSFCYDELEENCEAKGRLYSFEEAKVVCPKGWNLPNEKDWQTLENHFGMTKKMSDSIRIWRPVVNYDQFRELFNVQLGGMGEQAGREFIGLNRIAQYWVNENGPTGKQFALYRMVMNSERGIYSDQVPKSKLCCVRCLKE